MYTNSYNNQKVSASCCVVDESSELTNLFVHLIDEIILNAHISVQRRIAQQVNDLFTDEMQQRSSTYRFLLCVKKRNNNSCEDSKLMKQQKMITMTGDSDDYVGVHCNDDLMIRCLKAVELASDDLARLLLCRLMQGYLSHCKPTAMERRERRLVRLDATIYVMRALLKTLLEDTTVSSHSIVIDNLSNFLLRISNRDRKFTLKFRLVGLIGVLYNQIFTGKELQCSLILLRLMCRGVRSPRSTQLLANFHDFTLHTVRHLGNAKTVVDNSYTLKMTRFTEIIYFICENKKCKSALIDGMIIPAIQGMFERSFAMSKLNDADRFSSTELCLISLACIGQLSKMKKGREQLIANGAIEMCECTLNSIADDLKVLSEDLSLLSYLLKLQDLLCAICMRCLPAKPYPLCSSQLPFSFRFPLTRSTLSIQQSVNNNSTNKSTNPLKITTTILPAPSQNIILNSSNSDDNDDDGSGVEDEEEEEEEEKKEREEYLWVVRKDGDAKGYLNDFCDEDSDNLVGDLKQKCSLLHQNQDYDQLMRNYAGFFTEFFQSSTNSSSLSSSSLFNAHSSIVTSRSELVSLIAQQTNSVNNRFVKIAFPELLDRIVECRQQPLQCNTDSIRDVVLQEIKRFRSTTPEFITQIVYDLDSLIGDQDEQSELSKITPLRNYDRKRIGKMQPNVDHLLFESRFESGNLRKVIQVNKHHYELILSPDINQKRPHYQWFYFEVSNNEANVPYTFEVINCIKSTSMFSKGMQPVMFSVTEACLHDQCEWKRIGSSICYYRNRYVQYSNSVSNAKNKSNKKVNAKSKQKKCSPIRKHFSIRFTISFQHAADVCYIAYHFPYTYSFLQVNLERIMMRLNKLSSPHSFYMRNDVLCYSLAGNAVPLITITAFGTNEEINRREIVLLSARVHPGESNASWMMHGVIEFLSGSSSDAIELRNQFVFKLIPMLNTDGVINGNHRCSLAGTDLNRCWDEPSSLFHPTIFHSKGLVQYIVDVLKKKPFVYIDFHGHSRRYNVFVFGNNPKQSWKLSDRTLSDCYDLDQFMLLPRLLSQVSRSFSFSECRFNITKAKESSARVVLWRQFGISRAYTMEATYCGFSNGPYANNHIGISELKEIGRDLCVALLAMKKKSLECVGKIQNSTIINQHQNADSTSISD